MGSQPLVILAPRVMHAPSAAAGAAARYEVGDLCRVLGSLPILSSLPPLFEQGGSLAKGTLTAICIQLTLGDQIYCI